MRGRLTALLLLLATAASAQTTVTRTDRLVLANPPAKSAETACLWRDASTGMVAAGACPTGTVTSVGLTMPSIFSVSGSPITTSGTLAVSLANQNANLVFAGPTSGGAAAPTFRSLVKADHPAAVVFDDDANTFSQNQTFTGDIAVNGGDITASGYLNVTSVADLGLNPGGDLYVAPVGRDILPGSGYYYNLGALTNKYLTLHAAELWVQTLVAQYTMATIGGRILVAPTSALTHDVLSTDSTINTKHNPFAVGDRIALEANGQYELMVVTSGPAGSGPYTYAVTRDVDSSGPNNWSAGDAVISTGNWNGSAASGGFIDIYSTRGLNPGTTEYGPTIVGNARTGSGSNSWAPRWAIGNLANLYGYSSDTYGAAFGDPTASNLTIDPTNGIRFRNSTTVLGSLSSSAWVLGSTSTEHLSITSTAIEMKDGSTVLGSLSGAAWVLGSTSTEHLSITSTAIEMKDGSTVLGSWSGGTLTLGQPLTANNTGQIVIDSDSIDMNWRNNSGSTSTPFRISNSSGSALAFLNGWNFSPTTIGVGADGNTVVTVCSGVGCEGRLSAAGSLTIGSASMEPVTDNYPSLGSSAKKWASLYVTEDATGDSLYPAVWASGKLKAKTDGYSGACAGTVTVENGIVTGCP